MAIRSVFYIKDEKVKEKRFDIVWHRGLSLSQKQKNIESLNNKIIEAYNTSLNYILEISTKSTQTVGKELSAINLKFKEKGTEYFFESVYQSSKVFDQGLLGELQYKEWKYLPSFEAKKNSKQINLPLKKFKYNDKEFPLEPKTLFFDWLYIKTIHNISGLYDRLKIYFFTDIEFNPLKMVSSQAHSVAKFKYLYERV